MSFHFLLGIKWLSYICLAFFSIERLSYIPLLDLVQKHQVILKTINS